MSPLRDDLAALRSALDSCDASGDDGSALAELRRRCADFVESSSGSQSKTTRKVITADEMSAEVVDTNPYSRLMALQRMGIVTEYKRIREKTVAVVGIGGVGSVAAEMLTRCGIGKLQMYDFDVVELANMNRLFFRPEHAGITKTDAAVKTLREINPDVEYESFHMNITTVDGFQKFYDSLIDPDTKKSKVDLVLACVDNYEARHAINQACLELKQVWMESGVSEDAVSGHIQVMIPGETACFACVPPLVVASGIDEKTLKREGVCAASLPTTMGMVAGMLVQNTLKYLLHFGTVTHYLGYSALKDFFPQMKVGCTVDCDNGACRKAQANYKEKINSPEYLELKRKEDETKAIALAEEAAKPLHDANEWNIVVDCGDAEEQGEANASAASTKSNNLASGIEFSMPKSDKLDAKTVEQYKVEDTGAELEDLMSQLQGLNAGAK